MTGLARFDRTAGRLYLRSLGQAVLLTIRGDGGEETVLEATKLLALLVFLAYAPGQTATRDSLTDLLWSDLPTDKARHALRHHLWLLKQQVGADLIAEGDARGQLRLLSSLASDRAEFEAAIERRDFVRAVELYRGEFFPGFAATGSGEFERWIDGERTQLRSRFTHCAEAVIRSYLDAGRAREAVALARRLRDEEPFRQHTWRVLLESLIAANDPVAASIEADNLERMASDEGDDLEPATRSLMVAARRLTTAPRPANDAASFETELVGREKEFHALLAAWERARRGKTTYVHVGARPGLGKTRLLNELRARFASMRARCVLIRANAGTTTISHALASDLAEQLATLPGASGVSPEVAGVLVALNPSLASTFAARAVVTDAEEAARLRLIALTELVDAVAGERPLALLIDDFHWSDAPSRRLLAGLLGKLTAAPVLLVVSERPSTHHAPIAPAYESLTLQPLSEASVLALVSEIALLPRASWADSFVADLLCSTRGVPLQLVECLQLAIEQGALSISDGAWRCPSPDRLTECLESGSVLRRRLRQLTAEEFTVMRVLSAAGLPLEDRVLRDATGLSPAVTDTALADLHQKALVLRSAEGTSVVHDELAASMLELCNPDDVRDTHRVLGTSVAAHAAGDPRRMRIAASHFEAAQAIAPLRELFVEFYRSARARKDPRDARALARDLLGEMATPEKQRALADALTLRTRLKLTGRTREIVVILVMIVAAGLTSIVIMRRSSRVALGESDVVVTAASATGRQLVYAVPLSLTDWTGGTPIRIDALKPVFAFVRGWTDVPIAAPPPATMWAAAGLTGDSGQTDVFLIDAHGASRRVTYARGDDNSAAWSPDGSALVILTSRWSTRGRRDVAVLDPGRGVVRRLTDPHGSALVPKWSPDGTRIAYVWRTIADSPEEDICLIAYAGGTSECAALPPIESSDRALQWTSDSTLSTWGTVRDSVWRADLLDRGDSLSLRWASDARTVTGRYPFSPDGEWIALRCGTDRTCVAPIGESELARPLTLADTSAKIESVTWRTRVPRHYLQRIAVQQSTLRLAPAEAFQLDPAGYDQSGDPIPLRALRYQSQDTSIAVVDGHGRVMARRPGATTILLSAGGWRSVAIPLTVAAIGATPPQ